MKINRCLHTISKIPNSFVASLSLRQKPVKLKKNENNQDIFS